MGLAEQWHQERKARIARLWAGRPVEIKSVDAPAPVPVISVIRIGVEEGYAYGLLGPHEQTVGLPLSDILESVARKHGLSVLDVKAYCRTHRAINARLEFCYRAMTETDASTPAIGHFLNKRDHTTIISGAASHACKHGLPYPRGADYSNFIEKRRRSHAKYNEKARLKRQSAE